MKRKQQTTGLPRSRQQKNLKPETASAGSIKSRILGEYKSQAEREARIQQLIVGAAIFTLVVIGIILVAVFIIDQLVIPNQVVATVNDQTITVGEFQERVRFERNRLNQQINSAVIQFNNLGLDPNQALRQEPYTTWINELNFPDQLGRRVLDEMIDDILIAQGADNLNITVDDEQIQQEIQQLFGFDPTRVAAIGAEPTATPEPTITPTPFVSPTPSPVPTITPTPQNEEVTEETTAEHDTTAMPTLIPSPTTSREEIEQRFEDTVAAFRSASGDAQAEAYFRRLALRDAIQEQVTEAIERITYVDARHILVGTEVEAEDIISALEAGEPFGDLARANSIDTTSGARGGELGWTPVINFVDEFADTVSAAPIGEIIGPIETEFGYHVVQVRAREEREASEAEIERFKETAFEEWLEELRNSQSANIQIFDIWVDHVPRT